jgi:hypothetical protein
MEGREYFSDERREEKSGLSFISVAESAWFGFRRKGTEFVMTKSKFEIRNSLV